MGGVVDFVVECLFFELFDCLLGVVDWIDCCGGVVKVYMYFGDFYWFVWFYV